MIPFLTMFVSTIKNSVCENVVDGTVQHVGYLLESDLIGREATSYYHPHPNQKPVIPARSLKKKESIEEEEEEEEEEEMAKEEPKKAVKKPLPYRMRRLEVSELYSIRKECRDVEMYFLECSS